MSLCGQRKVSVRGDTEMERRGANLKGRFLNCSGRFGHVGTVLEVGEVAEAVEDEGDDVLVFWRSVAVWREGISTFDGKERKR
jgi:hypothetical protein